MISVLPEHLEEKRRLIARAYNTRILLILGCLFTLMLSQAFLLPNYANHDQRVWIAIGALALFAPFGAYAGYRAIKRGDQLCRDLGFLCPHCGKPLFEARGRIEATGNCPKCKRSIA
jgi:hypothetical protein